MRAFVLTLSIVLFTATANATTFYVATSGNDANAGTLASPFRTITKAAGVVRPGDVVEVRGGVYNELVKIGSKGTASAPIVFRSYGSETAIIDGSTTATDTNLVTLAGASYVELSRFEIRNAKRLGICGYPANFVKITNNYVHHSEKNAIYFGSTSSDVTIDGNTLSNNVLHNQYHNLTGGWGQTVGIQNTPRATVRNNRISQNDGEGICIILSDGAVVENNTLWDNFSVGIYLDNAQQTTVNANFIYSTGNTRYYRSGHPASGIGTANESYTTTNPLDALQITNNIVVNAKYGLYYSNEEVGGGLKNTTVANNTFYKATQTMLWIAAATHTGTKIQNNIFSQTGATMTSVAGSGIAYGSNNWYGGTAGTAAGPGDVIGDPRFANAGGLTPEDYRLLGGSVAVESALDLTSVVRADFWGHTRSAGIDMGAHEYSLFNSSIEGSADDVAPTTPSSLRVTKATSGMIALTWKSSTDNVGVTTYAIRRNGTEVATTSTTNWTDRDVAAGRTYTYEVAARDAAANESAPATVTATAGAARDTAAPTTPQNTRLISATPTTVVFRWEAADDNVGVTAYNVYRNGAFVKQVAVTGWTDQNVRPSTTYSYQLTAVDAAGNESAKSGALTVATGTGKGRAARH